MPRRPRKQPHVSNGIKAPKKTSTRKTDGKIKRWVRREDVQGDEEDEFHESRDRVLLGAEDGEDDDWDDGEEEVFGLGIEDDTEDDNEDDTGEEDTAINEGSDDLDRPSPRKSKKTQKSVKKNEASPSSSGSESEESESWGRKKSAYYASNEGLLADKEGEDDEEEAYEMEEREARRLQARMRETMDEEDYGLDDVMNTAASDALLEEDQLPAVSHSVPVEPLDRVTAIHRLEKTSPETLALAREWEGVVRDLMHAQQRLEELGPMPDVLALGLSHLHHQTLLTYVATLAFYLHIRAGLPMTTQSNNTPSRVNAILERLLTLKQALLIMDEYNSEDSIVDDYSEDSNISSLDEEEKVELERIFGTSGGAHTMKEHLVNVSGRKKRKLDIGELDTLLKEADAPIDDLISTRAKSHSRQTKTDLKNKKRTTPTLTSGTSLFDLVEPAFVPSKGSATRLDDDGLEAYGEDTALSMVDDTDKKARKRSLRFHTNKIENSARRREEGREKLGGDDDIPYRERKKEKEARVRREVEKTRGEGGDDLDADGPADTPSTGSGKRKRQEDSETSDEADQDGYYELVKRVKKEKKEGKKRQYDEARLRERVDIVEGGVSGPRSLTRAILKNKGLTPRRSKSVRNPRVKKRERFEKAKMKVRSQKAIYKGGLSGKPYSGEESGITKVVKSVKL